MFKLFLVAIAVFILYVVLDFVWFTAMDSFLRAEIGSIARLSAAGSWDVRISAAILVYVFMTIGMIFFVLPNVDTLEQAALVGALFGLVSYAIYDLTNLATLSAWTYHFALVDMFWGTLLNATVAVSAKWLLKYLF